MSNNETLVLVTGATGYISAWVIKYLLEDGYKVRGTIRDSTSKKSDFLRDLPGASERLELVTADLLSTKGWTKAVGGCDYVIHVASPFLVDVKDPQKDLVEPALEGTLNVLRAVKQHGQTVKRVVLTSSVAAISDSFEAGRVYTPNDWNTLSSLERNPYYYSKTVAEKAAWNFMESENPHFSFCTINPFTVMGPGLDLSAAVNQSVEFVTDLMSGEYPFCMNFATGIVDVRDVAIAHIKAMQTESAAGKRFLLLSKTLKHYELARTVKSACPPKVQKRIPTTEYKSLPLSLVTIIVRIQKGKHSATWIKTNWNTFPELDCSLAKDILHIQFREAEKTVQDTVEWALINKKYKV